MYLVGQDFQISTGARRQSPAPATFRIPNFITQFNSVSPVVPRSDLFEGIKKEENDE